jgi:hypothetical protein
LESPEHELADGLHVDFVLDLSIETLGDQYLAGGRLVGQRCRRTTRAGFGSDAPASRRRSFLERSSRRAYATGSAA